MQVRCLLLTVSVLLVIAIPPAAAGSGKPFISIDPVGNHTTGDTFTISGTTNLPVNTTLKLQIYYMEVFTPAGTGTSFSDNVIMQPGTDGNNTWSYVTSPAQWHSWGGPHSEWYGEPIPPGLYSVNVTSTRLNVTAAPQYFFMEPEERLVTSSPTGTPVQAPASATATAAVIISPPKSAAPARAATSTPTSPCTAILMPGALATAVILARHH